MESLKLMTGFEMPILGLGTWKSKPGEVTNAVKAAIEFGYRHIDCASIYGNEAEVGAGIKDCIDKGIVKREELFITSKLWCTDLRSDLVRGAFDKTLTNLGLEYLDLYLIHWPMAFKEGGERFPRDEAGNVIFSDADHLDTWKVLEELVDEKKIRSIGISNFNKRLTERLLGAARIKPAVLQVEVSPYCPNLKLVEFVKSLGIQVTAYSPLGSPDSTPPTPENPGVLKEPAVLAMAEKYGKSPAQVLIRYCIDRNIIVIPKSVTPSRIKENMQVFDFKLSDEDLEKLNSFGPLQRTAKVVWAKEDRFYPFNDEY